MGNLTLTRAAAAASASHPPLPTFMNFLRIINWRKGNGGTMEGTNDQVASHLSSGAGVNAAWATTWKEGRRDGGVKGAIHVHRGGRESLHNRIGPD